jgi:hypothetical protein
MILYLNERTMPLRQTIQTQGGGPATPLAESEGSKPHIFRGALVLLTDDNKCRLARIENISILEAFQNATFVHFDEGKILFQRSSSNVNAGWITQSPFAPAVMYRQSESGESATSPQRKAYFHLKG